MDAQNNFSTNNLVLKLNKPQRNFARGTRKSSKEQNLGNRFLSRQNEEWTFKANDRSGEVGQLQSQKDFL